MWDARDSATWCSSARAASSVVTGADGSRSTGVHLGEVLTLVGLVIAIIAAWFAWRAIPPRRRLDFGLTSDVPIVHDVGSLAELEVRSGGRLLERPRVVQLRVVGRGRSDIAAASFGDRPLVLDLGVPIVKLLDMRRANEAEPAPTVACTDTALRLGPSFIGKKQDLTYTIMVDGPPARLTYEATLLDVNLHPDLASPIPASLIAAFVACVVLAVPTGALLSPTSWPWLARVATLFAASLACTGWGYAVARAVARHARLWG